MKKLIEYLIWINTEIRRERINAGLKPVPLFDAIKSYYIMKKNFDKRDK
jgi:hypothetical protein